MKGRVRNLHFDVKEITVMVLHISAKVQFLTPGLLGFRWKSVGMGEF